MEIGAPAFGWSSDLKSENSFYPAEVNPLLKSLPEVPLTPAAEQAALAAGDHDSIVLHALPSAFGYLKRLSRGRLQDNELLSAAYAALVKAVKNFKPGWGRFVSYARPYLRGGLAAEWRFKDVVRNASKHETPMENDERREALVSPDVDPEWDGIHWAEVWEQVEPTIRATLSRVEIQVLEGRYKFSLTLAETGEKIGRSRERVRQIEKSALHKLRAALSNKI